VAIVFGGNSEVKGLPGTPRHRWEYNGKMDLQEIKWVHELE